MTSRLDSTVAAEGIWQVLDGQVEAGRMPGYVAAVRVRGKEHVRAGGRTGVEPGSPPMRDDTQSRIASITIVMEQTPLQAAMIERGVFGSGLVSTPPGSTSRRPNRGRRRAAGAGRAGPGPRHTSIRCATPSPCC